MKHKHLIILLTLAISTLAACGIEKNVNPGTGTPPRNTPIVDMHMEETKPTPTATPALGENFTPTPHLPYLDSLNLSDLTFYDIDKDVTKPQMFASMGWDVQDETQSYEAPQVISTDGNNCIIACHTMKYTDDRYVYGLKLLNLNFSEPRISYKVLTTFEDTPFFGIFKGNRDFLWSNQYTSVDYADYSEAYYTYSVYDTEGNIHSNIKLPEDAIYVTANKPEQLYSYDSDKYVALKFNTFTGESTVLPLDNRLMTKYIESIIEYDGETYYFGGFMGSDLNHYNALINEKTGEILYCQPNDTFISLSEEKNYVLFTEYDYNEFGSFNHNSFIKNGKETRFSYSSDNTEASTNFIVVSDHLVLFVVNEYEYEPATYVEEGEEYTYDELTSVTTKLGLFDIDTGKLVATTTFNPSPYSYVDYGFTLKDDNQLVFSTAYESGAVDYYIWNISGITEPLALPIEVSVEDFKGFTKVLPEGTITRDLLTSKELSDEYSKSNAIADALEEKYGVQIYIANEANTLMGNYLITGETDNDMLLNAFEDLNKALSAYPEGFFEKYKESQEFPDGLSIYLASSIEGINGSDVLDTAAGLTNDGNTSIDIAIDCGSFDLVSTIHHELSHTMDDLLDSFGFYYDYDEWNKLNIWFSGIDKDFYNYSYGDYLDYDASDNFILYSGTNESVLFIDRYALTYPTEDRARLFEYYMAHDYFSFDNFPGLKLKLNSWLDRIKEYLGFDFR